MASCWLGLLDTVSSSRRACWQRTAVPFRLQVGGIMLVDSQHVMIGHP